MPIQEVDKNPPVHTTRNLSNKLHAQTVLSKDADDANPNVNEQGF
jgi:hypothetical protein